jgi:hypothetical protein
VSVVNGAGDGSHERGKFRVPSFEFRVGQPLA